MKIVEFNTEYIEEKNRLGLQCFKMNKLGDVVLLAGKNGSGKSRIMRLLRQYAKQSIETTAQKPRLEREKNNLIHSSADLQKFLDGVGSAESRQYQIDQAKESLRQNTIRLNEIERALNEKKAVKIESTDELTSKIVFFVPKNNNLKDWRQLRQSEWKDNAHRAYNIGCEHLSDTSISLIQDVYDQYWNVSHPDYEGDKSQIEVVKSNFERLQDIVCHFLGTHLSRNVDSVVTIFNKPINEADLSDGQKVLLQLCVAIYAQGAKISDYILLMDEPENHLHPSAVIEFVERVRVLNPNGQIWLATHSIALLSHFDPSSIWYVKDGCAAYSGRQPEQVLEGLLGNEENIHQLQSFINLPNEFAANRFAFECLLPPGVVNSNSTDPQFCQFKKILENIWASGCKKISLLDYGAGKGRMISNLSQDSRITPEMLDYVAYDEYDSDKKSCISHIECFYNDAEKRYFNRLDDLRASRDDKSFDIVLMCNVLHEIPHNNWVELFKNLSKLLKDDGNLLLIEDCRIPVGEKPHQKGFMVFNTVHLKDLFGISSNDSDFAVYDARPDSDKGRLMAHLIPAKYLGMVSNESKKKAIKDLCETSKKEIIRIRGLEPSYKNGMSHAFWTQQLANATLCLTELE